MYNNRGYNKINYVAMINNSVYKLTTANSENQQCEPNKHTKWYTSVANLRGCMGAEAPSQIFNFQMS